MARFRGTVKGGRGEASRLGSKISGITSFTSGWDIGVKVEIRYDEVLDTDVVTIFLTEGSRNYNTYIQLGEYTVDAEDNLLEYPSFKPIKPIKPYKNKK